MLLFDSSRRFDHFGVVERQNRTKNGEVMATQILAKSSRAANYGPTNWNFSHIILSFTVAFLPVINVKSEMRTNFKPFGLKEVILSFQKPIF